MTEKFQSLIFLPFNFPLRVWLNNYLLQKKPTIFFGLAMSLVAPKLFVRAHI